MLGGILPLTHDPTLGIAVFNGDWRVSQLFNTNTNTNMTISLIVVSANLRDIMNIIMKINPSLITAERCFW